MFKEIKKVVSMIISFGLFFQQVSFAQMAAELNLAGYLSQMHSAMAIERFRPVHLRYFNYDLATHDFKVLVDKGDFEKGLSPKGTDPKQLLQEETKTLLNYFLVGLTLNNESFWVNLRPDAEDQIIDSYLVQTDVGRIMLEADLQLKKDTAKFTSPETPEGKEYWNRLYKKAEELFGYDNVSIPTLTRPWIVPGEIIIHETDSSAYVYKATLKVMLEQDYLKDSSVYNFKDARSKALNDYSSELIRELIIPKLTKEVNSSKRYANIRQVYYSLILSRWFKNKFADKKGLSPQGTVPNFIDRINTLNLTGLTSKEAWSKTTYFKEYQKSFQQGEYNIKEPVYTPTGQVIRSYFSGGMALQNINPDNGIVAASPIVPKMPGTVMLKGDSLGLREEGAAGSPLKLSKTDAITKINDLKKECAGKILMLGNYAGATDLMDHYDQAIKGLEEILKILKKSSAPYFSYEEIIGFATKLPLYSEETRHIIESNMFNEAAGSPITAQEYRNYIKGFQKIVDSVSATEEIIALSEFALIIADDPKRPTYLEKARSRIKELPADHTVGAIYRWALLYAQDPESEKILNEFEGLTARYTSVDDKGARAMLGSILGKSEKSPEILRLFAVGTSHSEARVELGAMYRFGLMFAKPDESAEYLREFKSLADEKYLEAKDVLSQRQAVWSRLALVMGFGSEFTRGLESRISGERLPKLFGEITREKGLTPEFIKNLVKDQTVAMSPGGLDHYLFQLNSGDLPLFNTVFNKVPVDTLSIFPLGQGFVVGLINEGSGFRVLNINVSSDANRAEGAILLGPNREQIEELAAETIDVLSGIKGRVASSAVQAKQNEGVVVSSHTSLNDLSFEDALEKIDTILGEEINQQRGIEPAVALANEALRYISYRMHDNKLEGFVGALLDNVLKRYITESKKEGKDFSERMSRALPVGWFIRTLLNASIMIEGDLQHIKIDYRSPRGRTIKGYFEKGNDIYQDLVTEVLMKAEEILSSKAQQGEGVSSSLTGTSSPMTPGGIDASLRSASIPDKGMGGIDFRSLPMTIKPMGSFEGLNLKLPRLSSSALMSFNINEEIQQLNQMISGGIMPSGARVEELVSAAWQKGKLQDFQSEILTILAEICKLQEGECCESSEELKVALVVANAV